MHAFLRLIRAQVENDLEAWDRLTDFAHGGEVRCGRCEECICERRGTDDPPFSYICVLCDKGVPALGDASSDMDLALGPWRTYLDQFCLRLAFGPKSKRRPSGKDGHRLRRVEAIRDEVDRFVSRHPEATAALFGLLELPPIVSQPTEALEPRQEMGTLIHLPRLARDIAEGS